jgi:hypothetical protein
MTKILKSCCYNLIVCIWAILRQNRQNTSVHPLLKVGNPWQIWWIFSQQHRKKLASVGAANQIFFVVTKSAGTAPTVSASGKLAARTVTQIKVLVCLNHCN